MSITLHRPRTLFARSAIMLIASAAIASKAFAHGAERGLVMLLPTQYYMVGAAFAVGLSCILLTSENLSARLISMFNWRFRLFALPSQKSAIPSLLALLYLIAAICSGLFGSRDPLSNILPLSVWTGWWIGFTLLQVCFGDLWKFLNPWSGLVRALHAATRGTFPKDGLATLPRAIGYLPAIILFAAFAWFELISAAPEDPAGLALAITAYWLINFAAIILFGLDDWLGRGEPFSVFFRLIGGFSPFSRATHRGKTTIGLQMPGAQYVTAPPLPLSGVCFVLIVLGAASFDGLAETFEWMGWWGINPLEYAGRTSVYTINSFGLLATAFLLGLGFYCALFLGLKLSSGTDLAQFAGRIIYSIIPISIAFHAAHYLTMVLINGQYLLKALSDPFNLGWDLFGTASDHVTASMVQNIDTVWMIWTAQVVIIALGHMVGIVLAHPIATDWFGSHQRAARSQVPLAALMVFYTVFGLWLLATPTIG
jgi:hypothetical protein